MKREVRTMIVIAVAIVVGGIAALFVARQARQVPVREVEVGKATMVIASYDLPLGTKLTRDNVKAVPWPSTTPIVGSFSNIDQVLERGVIAHVVANEPITESKLAPTQAGTGLPPAIPKGMRAVSIKVNDVIGVAGFVVPGTRVDVVATVDESGSGGARDSMSRVVLSDVTVLTAGTRYDQEAARKEGKPIPATVVTLMVTPQDAERVALAAEKSRLMLALRNPLDLDPTETPGIRMAALMRTAAPESPKPAPHRAAPPPPPPPPPPPAAPTRYTVEAIKGAKRTEEVLH